MKTLRTLVVKSKNTAGFKHLAYLLLLILFTPAYGQSTFIGSETRANSTTINTQQNAATAMDTSGRFIVVWESEDQDGDDYGIYASIFDKTGAVSVSEFKVNSTTAESQRYPSVACAENGNFVITWMSEDQDGDAWGIYFRTYTIDGTSTSSEIRANSTTSGQQKFPHVSMNKSGAFAITWMTEIAGSQEVAAKYYTSDGTATSGDLTVNTTIAGNQSNSRVALRSDGQYVVVWQSSGQDGDGNGIYGQLMATDGSKVGSEFIVNTETAKHQEEPDVDIKDDGKFVVVWSSLDQDGSSKGIYGQLFTPAAAADGSEFAINTTTAGAQGNPSVCVSDSGFFVVTWNSYGQDGSYDGVYLMEYNPFGEVYGSETKVNTTTVDFQQFPEISFTKDDLDMVIVWQGGTRNNTTTNDLSKYGVFFQLGNIKDIVDPVANCVGPFNLYLNSSGSSSLVPADLDNGSTDNSGLFSLSLSKSSFSCVDLNANNINLIVTDAAGNTNSCTVAVTIIDTISPTAAAQNITVYLDGSGSASITAADIDNGSTDNCGTPTLSASKTTFTCADIGVNNVTLTATDGSSNTNYNSAAATVTVSDTISPIAICQNKTIILDASGNASIIASDLNNGSSDNCSSISLSISKSSFTCADLGTNNVTFTVIDGSSNTKTCIAVVTVTVTAPTITSSTPASRCGPGTVNLAAAGSAGTLNWFDASTEGNNVGTGSPITSPYISTTTSYWVEADNNGCKSVRTEVVATINALPTVDVITNKPANIAYTLPVLTNGNYFTGIGGTGTALSAGNKITTNQTVYIYADNGTCTNQSSFNVAILTTLIGVDCGKELGSPAELLHVRAIPGAMNYRFEVTDGTTTWFYTRGSAIADFRLSNVSSAITYGKTYTIKIAISYDGTTWGAYGNSCSVTILPKIKPWYCGITVSTLNSWMGTYEVPGAVNYRYELFDGTTTLTHTRGSADNGLVLTWVPGIQLNKTYLIRVAYSLDGTIWSGYGPACSVSTPAVAAISSWYCGKGPQASSKWYQIENIPGATHYNFELVNGGTTLNLPKAAATTNGFKPNQVSGIQINTTYQVRVKYSIDGGSTWSAYGPVCTIATNGTAITKQDNDFEIVAIANLETYPNPNNGDFTISSTQEGTFNIINELGQLIQTVEITKENNYQVELRSENLQTKLQPGVYFVTGIVNNELMTNKIIVQ